LTDLLSWIRGKNKLRKVNGLTLSYPQRDIPEHEINNLKDCIVAQFGQSITTKGDCDKLSESIETNVLKNVSVNTLRRFFDVMPTLSKPSLETLK